MSKQLSEVMRELAETIKGQLEEAKAEERQQALVEVNNILVWLHMEPTPSIEDLRKWTLLEFAKASAKLDSASPIRKTIFHYRNLPKQSPQ